jgi:hypothetical protein
VLVQILDRKVGSGVAAGRGRFAAGFLLSGVDPLTKSPLSALTLQGRPLPVSPPDVPAYHAAWAAGGVVRPPASWARWLLPPGGSGADDSRPRASCVRPRTSLTQAALRQS